MPKPKIIPKYLELNRLKNFAAPSVPQITPIWPNYRFFCSFETQFFEINLKFFSMPYIPKFLSFVAFLSYNFSKKSLNLSKRCFRRRKCEEIPKISSLFVEILSLWRGHPPWNELNGALAGCRPPNIRHIILNLSPNILAIGRAEFWAQSTHIWRRRSHFRKVLRFVGNIVSLKCKWKQKLWYIGFWKKFRLFSKNSFLKLLWTAKTMFFGFFAAPKAAHNFFALKH